MNEQDEDEEEKAAASAETRVYEERGPMPHLEFPLNTSSFRRLGPGLLFPEGVDTVGYKLALVANGATGGTQSQVSVFNLLLRFVRAGFPGTRAKQSKESARIAGHEAMV